ncbi:glycoside hydrolase family 9 protein [Asticcacaulis solisilvae]|uniref:glycoside hydrolase family 9 protein n=1 Tax=Asticcacaulis solisilvae TaxID=1217274 RepID=UPI003FD6C249
MGSLSRRQWLMGAGAALAFTGQARAADTVNPIVDLPKLNQIGFRPDAAKRFCLTVAGASETPSGADAGADVLAGGLNPIADPTAIPLPGHFTVETETGETVFSGGFGPILDLTKAAGERVASGDFSALTRPGRYRIRCGERVSAPFAIADTVYRPLLHDAARTFYIIRANAALNDPVTGLSHAAGHPADAHILVGKETRDLTGGWYNAGDFGKWTHMAAISSSQMMWLYELRPAAADVKLDMPALWPLPDLLQQARWGLEWLLRMQNRDGSVLHKVDTEPLYAWGKPPAEDPNPRNARGASSLDAGVFVGAMSQASRVFAKADPAFAKRCRAAALKSWAWLKANPNVLHSDPFYVDPDVRQEVAWATSEMAVLIGDADLASLAWGLFAPLKTRDDTGILPFFWPSPQVLGAMALARYAKGPARDAAISGLHRAATALAAIQDGDPYGYAAIPALYSWGSLEMAFDSAVVCLFAHEVTGDAVHRRTAQRVLDYALGCNALNLSFVTGHGTHFVSHPYNWTYRTQKKLMPGWPSGGPNGQPQGADPLLGAVIARGTPPAKCFVDACEDNGAWACNEGQTTETAALVLAAGLLAI